MCRALFLFFQPYMLLPGLLLEHWTTLLSALVLSWGSVSSGTCTRPISAEGRTKRKTAGA